MPVIAVVYCVHYSVFKLTSAMSPKFVERRKLHWCIVIHKMAPVNISSVNLNPKHPDVIYLHFLTSQLTIEQF